VTRLVGEKVSSSCEGSEEAAGGGPASRAVGEVRDKKKDWLWDLIGAIGEVR